MGKATLSGLQSFVWMCNALRKIERLWAKNVEHHRRQPCGDCVLTGECNKQYALLESSVNLSTFCNSSISEVLITLCRDFLGGYHYQVSFSDWSDSVAQAIRYRRDRLYTIQNLATYLRDGVRLGRMTEILTCGEPKTT
jgi:hypothetical protein